MIIYVPYQTFFRTYLAIAFLPIPVRLCPFISTSIETTMSNADYSKVKCQKKENNI